MRSVTRTFATALALTILIGLAGPLQSQSFSISACHGDEGNTHNSTLFGSKEKVCELRRATIPLVNGQISVSAKNGGIEVIGEDRQNIALEARVVAQDSSVDEARALLKEIKIVTDGTNGASGSIRAEGPSVGLISNIFGKSWYVNFRLHVPRRLAAELQSENGGIDIANIDGNISAHTTNGGLTLRDLSGKVHASTVNGGVDITLKGTQWRGDGLYAKSTNGGVSIKAADNYSAHLIAATVNGGVAVAFPITLNGADKGSSRNHVDTQIGQGGPTIEVETVNGGISVDNSAGDDHEASN